VSQDVSKELAVFLDRHKLRLMKEEDVRALELLRELIALLAPKCEANHE
jgi:hypothetical protein